MAFYDSADAHYLEGLAAHAPLDRETETELATRWRDHHDRAALQALVYAHLRFVVRVANRYRGAGVQVDDLIAEGNLGLLEAVEHFDPTRGVRFISYAAYWVRAFILAYIFRQWSLVRLSGSARRSRLFFRLRRARAQLTSALGHQLSPDDIDLILAKRMSSPVSLVRDMTQALERRDARLDLAPSPGSPRTPLDLLRDPHADPETRAISLDETELVKRAVNAFVGELPARERYIFEHRIYSLDPATLREVGRHLGVSRERVRQLETMVLRKLRRALADLDPERRAA